MTLPDFLIIGAAKSGTTTLYQYLSRHPQVFMSKLKEPAYFARDEMYRKGLKWYESLFDDAQKGNICGEASTAYTHQTSHKPQIPQLIHDVMPEVKMIYLMRNPVDRAYSNYLQQIKAFQRKHRKAQLKSFEVPETFEQLLSRGSSVVELNDYMEKIDVVATSKYIDNIKLYLEYFPDDSFLFILFEDLINKPKDTLIKVFDFLGVDSSFSNYDEEIEANTSVSHAQWYLRERRTLKIKSLPIIAQTYKMFPKKGRDYVYSWLSKIPYLRKMEDKYIPPKMLPKTRIKLLKEFEKPNQELAKFLNRDLSLWNR